MMDFNKLVLDCRAADEHIEKAKQIFTYAESKIAEMIKADPFAKSWSYNYRTNNAQTLKKLYDSIFAHKALTMLSFTYTPGRELAPTVYSPAAIIFEFEEPKNGH